MSLEKQFPILGWIGFVLSVAAFVISAIGFAVKTVHVQALYTSVSQTNGASLKVEVTYLNGGGTYAVVTESRYALTSRRGKSQPACEDTRQFGLQEAIGLAVQSVALEAASSANRREELDFGALETGPYSLCAYHEVHDAAGGYFETAFVIMPLITWDGVEFDSENLDEEVLDLARGWHFLDL
ncbi:MAG: hypothetical protein AAFU41_04115 [Pseudomonadota bacterium]